FAAVGQGLRVRGEQPRALAAVGALVDEAALHVALEPIERAAPVAGDAAEFEHRLPGPHRHRGVLGRLLGIGERGGVVVAALSSKVSGSRRAMRTASAVNFLAARASPEPTAISPCDTARYPRSPRRMRR